METTKTYVENPSGKLAVTVHAPRSLREEEAAYSAPAIASCRILPIAVSSAKMERRNVILIRICFMIVCGLSTI